MSPSFAWLQAFLSAADHLDYRRAAVELGISTGRIKLRVEKLEQWLHKLLILDDPMELDEIGGVQFMSVARAALQRFEAACSDGNGLATGVSADPRTKLVSKIRLNDLERFLAVAEERTYKGAAIILSCDVSTVHRSVNDLERVTEHELLSGRVAQQLTEAGEMVRDAASFIVESLNGFRAVIPDSYDPRREKITSLHEVLKRQQTKFRMMERLIVRSGKKQRGRVRLDNVNQYLKFVTEKINEMEEDDPSLGGTMRGIDLDIPALVNLDGKVRE